MFTPRNGVPYNDQLGMKDESIQPLVAKRFGDPIHKPLMFVLSPKGKTNEAFPLAGDNLKKMLGAEVLKERGRFATFNTPFLKLCNSEGNEMMCQRLKTPDGKTANARAVVEVVVKSVDIYERDPISNKIIYNSDGSKKVKEQREGLVMYHYLVPINETTGLFGQGRPVEGALIGSNDVKSMIYPLYDTVAPYYGAACNGYGWRIEPLSTISSSKVEEDYHREVGARVYNFTAFERPEGASKPRVWPTIAGGNTVKVAFKEGARFEPGRLDLDYKDILPDAYRVVTPPRGMLPDPGIFDAFHFYEDTFETLVGLMRTADVENKLPEVDKLVDVFGGVDFEGSPYDGIIINPIDGDKETISYNGTAINYMFGGDDGTINNEVYDQLVREEMEFFGEGTVKYNNRLKYSLGILYDSGFSFDTKERLINFISAQKSTFLVLSTHVHNLGTNDEQAEEAAKTALAAMISTAPESIYHGTGSGARATIVGQSYQLVSTVSEYKERVPLTWSVCRILTQYAGAKDPRFNPLKRVTRGEHTVITEGVDINIQYKPMSVYSTDWDVGMIAARNFDYQSLFLPALSTAYLREDSVIRNLLFSFAMTWVQRISDQVWAECSGEGTMTNPEYARLVENKIIDKIGDRLDVIAKIRPKVYFTAEDVRNGNTAHVDIISEGNTLKTQHITTIVARREQAGE